MTHQGPAAAPVLTSAEAQLFVADVNASCDFYTRQLGFTVAFFYGDPPFYGQVTRDQARLNLRAIAEPVFAGDVREREHLLSASLTVATPHEVQQLFLLIKPRECAFFKPSRRSPGAPQPSSWWIPMGI